MSSANCSHEIVQYNNYDGHMIDEICAQCGEPLGQMEDMLLAEELKVKPTKIARLVNTLKGYQVEAERIAAYSSGLAQDMSLVLEEIKEWEITQEEWKNECNTNYSDTSTAIIDDVDCLPSQEGTDGRYA